MKKNVKAYTLIEILIVTIIVGVLASLAFVQFGVVTERAYSKRLESMLFEIIASQNRYRTEHGGAWAPDFAALDYNRGVGGPLGNILRMNISATEMGIAIFRYENDVETATATFPSGSTATANGSYVLYAAISPSLNQIIVRCSDGVSHPGICGKLGY